MLFTMDLEFNNEVFSFRWYGGHRDEYIGTKVPWNPQETILGREIIFTTGSSENFVASTIYTFTKSIDWLNGRILTQNS